MWRQVWNMAVMDSIPLVEQGVHCSWIKTDQSVEEQVVHMYANNTSE